MLLRYKILIGLLIVAVLVAIGVTLGIILTEDDDDKGDVTTTQPPPDVEDICETSNIYRKNKKLLEMDPVPFFLRNMRKGPPDLIVNYQQRAKIPEFAWITQKVDHFNPSDSRTWQMRYLKNDEFYENGGPIFIYLGGEWEIRSGSLMTGQLYDMAKEHKGYMFYTEHRYYGQSYPTSDLCTESMQYLNMDQALADVVYFIDHQKSEIPSLKNSKVVLLGCSYSATMATWLRVKYPHKIDAAIASSAPLLAIEDFYQYYEVVTYSMSLTSPECVKVISEAIQEVETLLENNGGIETLTKDFRTCYGLNLTEPHKSYFFSNLISPFASMVQYAQPGDIEKTCESILKHTGSSYERFQKYFQEYISGYCIGSYDSFTTHLDYPLPNGDYRQWMYQTCTEYGFYQTTSSDDVLFGKNTINVELYRKMCEDVYDSFLLAHTKPLLEYEHKQPLSQNVIDAITPIYMDLSKTELLERCMGGFTQSSNESFNALIWKFAPKMLSSRAIIVQIATYLTVSIFNDGMASLLKVANEIQIQIGSQIISPEALNSGIKRTNLFYGGLKPSLSKVVTIHGSIDPWSSIGVLESLNEDAPVFVVQGTSHCADISSESDGDLPEMKETKRKVKELIRKWITD